MSTPFVQQYRYRESPADIVIREFNDIVNMSAKELQDWLGQEESAGAGWNKDDGSGETIGHERQATLLTAGWPLAACCFDIHGLILTLCSGRKIIEILEKNPKKDPSKYDQDDIQHMRRVVAYCKRHLAQEGKAKQDPDSKSAKSL